MFRIARDAEGHGRGPLFKKDGLATRPNQYGPFGRDGAFGNGTGARGRSSISGGGGAENCSFTYRTSHADPRTSDGPASTTSTNAIIVTSTAANWREPEPASVCCCCCVICGPAPIRIR